MIHAEHAHPGDYDITAVEAKWQAYWDRNGVFNAPNPGQAGFDPGKPKCYVLDMFPYPSGAGLHVGHPVGYCATDIYSRYKRMKGFNVLHAIGFDAFGLPAEQYAIQTGVHPAVTTKRNIDNMRRQLKACGLSYDWPRELSTCDPDYYKFTQWIFIQLFNSWYDRRIGRARPIDELYAALEDGSLGVTDALTVGFDAASASGQSWSGLDAAGRRQVIDGERLVYLAEVPVNWCPGLGTVLSNEEVTNDGRSEIGDHPVFRRPLRQWMMRITRYADRLLQELDQLDWPEAIKLMQRNWIGRSTGAEVDFPIASGGSDAPTIGDYTAWRAARGGVFTEQPADNVIRVYTTRPDTLFGATYMVLAPEHPLVERITNDDRRSAVRDYVETARHRSELDRKADTKAKTGVFTGAYAINPVNAEPIPIWVADYVVMGYGTGAIMAVPGGDTRDFEFAKAFDLDIIAVVEPTLEWAEQVARLPQGTLGELRASAAQTIKQSIQRWKSDRTGQRAKHIDFAESFLDQHADDLGLDPETIRELYVTAPRIFAHPFTDEGVAVHSPAGGTGLGDQVCSLNGLPTDQAKRTITEWLVGQGLGREAVNYKLRDWIFSRQKYWGEPFPVLYGPDGEIECVDEADLPVTLPDMTDFKPEVTPDDPTALPRPPLGRATDWINLERNGKSMTRDVNTMPQWAGSCWYYLRYCSPNDPQRFCDARAEKYWMPIDVYVGGAEHAVLHLLYARFWHKVLFDLGHVTTEEPFRKLINQGMIQAFAFRDAGGRVLRNDQVEQREDGTFVVTETNEPATQFVAKMSKSLKNVVNPDEIIAEYGADTFRMYEMYMGPIESSKPWNTRDVPGLLKLLRRIWRLVVDPDTGGLSPRLVDSAPDESTSRLLHKTIRTVTEDIEQFKFNTAIAGLFEFVNAMTPRAERPRAVIEPFVLLVSPFAPHLAEELWSRLGHAQTLAFEPWPAFDPKLAKDVQVEVAVQVMGKIKSRIMGPADLDEPGLEAAALGDETIRRELADKTVRKVIVVKGRLVNIVAN